MADVSKLNGYNLRDDTARSQINTINNTTIPNINARIDDLATGNNLHENKHIVFSGDSNWAFGTAASDKMLELMPGCTVENIHTGGQSWDNIYTQITGYSGTPDILILCAGGNSIPGTITQYDLGRWLGAPNPRDHTVPDMTVTANQNMFNWMKASFEYIRNTWPRCLVFVVIRANQPKKPRSAWYYLKFYEQQICQEWGVPVIDANNIMNQTFWNDVQTAIYNQSDGQHYTAEAYQRYIPTIGAMIEANAAVQFSQMPSHFLVPMAAVDTSLPVGSQANAIAMVKWIAANCCPMFTGSWAVSGRAQAYMGAGVADSARFAIEVNYNDDLECDIRGFVWLGDREIVAINESTYSNDTHERLGSVMIKRTIESYATAPSLRSLPDGIYSMLNASAAAYNQEGDLPTAYGGLLTVCTLASPGQSGSYNRIYQYTRASNGDLYTGFNYGGGAITWSMK